MARKTANGTFEPKNPKKYIGSGPITYRSNWERQYMAFLDDHPYVLGWASESFSIPYKNPLLPENRRGGRGKWSMYVPDFLVVYVDRNNKKHAELIEIKPAKESPLHEATNRLSPQARLVREINAAKWMAAAKYCAQRGWTFRVMTEAELFGAKV